MVKAFLVYFLLVAFALGVLFVAAVVVLLANPLFQKWMNLKHLIVFEHERAIKYVRGTVSGVVGAGSYWYLPHRESYEKVDMRRRIEFQRTKLLHSSDGKALKIGFELGYEVADPVAAKSSVNYYPSAVRMVARDAFLELVAALTADEVIQNQDELCARVLQKSAKRMEYLGVRLGSVQIVEVRLHRQARAVMNDRGQFEPRADDEADQED